ITAYLMTVVCPLISEMNNPTPESINKLELTTSTPAPSNSELMLGAPFNSAITQLTMASDAKKSERGE
ncbi:MAG: hypothetical protein ACPGSJ_13450, partial [Pseudoalteromonas spongiae]